jgi:hypothetical protein
MLHLVRKLMLFAAVIVFAALSGLTASTPALAHGAHNFVPVAHTGERHAGKVNAYDRSKVQSVVHEARGPAHHDDHRGGTVKGCCGVLCLSAMTQASVSLVGITVPRFRSLPPLQPKLSGRGPARLDRPPAA